jgi:heterodisulfide reductase subunit B2
MEISYYPGCTLKANAKNLETTTLPLLELFDIQTKELEEWYCCGVSFSQASDNLMQQLAPIRTLIRAKESGNKKLLVPCDMCYNTLKRASNFVLEDSAKRDTIKEFMTLENVHYNGDEIEVTHLLTVLKNFAKGKISDLIKKPAEGLKIAPYYGCMILRPKEIAVDDSNDPTIMEDILKELNVDIVDFPFRNECCTSYQVVNERDIVKERTHQLVSSAAKRGAEMIVLSCPLCNYNLDAVQKDIKKDDASFKTLPVLYLSQLMALMLGLDSRLNDFSLHHIDPKPLLKEKGLI